MLIAKCLKGKYEAKLKIPGREGYKPNNNPSLDYMYFLEPHIFVTQIIYYLNEEPLMLFISVDSLGVDSFSILLIMAVGREKI